MCLFTFEENDKRAGMRSLKGSHLVTDNSFQSVRRELDSESNEFFSVG